MDQEENESLCERILWDLDNIFKKDTNITEFDIIDVGESKCNKSPVIYESHNIALEKWCVPHLYEYACRKILNFKQNNNRSDNFLLHQWTRIILLLNPDFTTAWNLRRNLLIQSVNSHSEELKFADLVLIRKPKCASVFSYREWLLNHYLFTTKEMNEELIRNELKTTLEAADRYPRNYYAWSHRTWLITVYIKNSPIDYILNKILEELHTTENWLEKHISDYSCFQHRQCLFHLIFNCKNVNTNHPNPNGCSTSLLGLVQNLYFNEFKMLQDLWRLYPEQESLYLHRRFLLHAATVWCPNRLDSLKEEEIQFQQIVLKKLRTEEEGSAHSWKNELIRRYLFYLKRNLNWSFES